MVKIAQRLKRFCFAFFNRNGRLWLINIGPAYGVFILQLSFEGLSANDPKMEALPEVALLDYLLTSKYILDLRNTAALHRRVDDYAFYFGKF